MKYNISPVDKYCFIAILLAKWRQRVVKNVKNSVFRQKVRLFTFLTIIRCGSKFASMRSKYVSNNVWKEFLLLVSVFATVARKSFNGKFTAKIGHFTRMLQLLTLALEI